MPRRRTDIRVDAYVDIDDVLDELDDADLIAELERRKKEPPVDAAKEALTDLRHLLLQGRANEALVIVERMLFPDKRDRLTDYERAKKNRDPVTGRPVVQ